MFSCQAPTLATTYNIGPGQTYTTFTALVAAENLQPDDVVDGGGNTFTEAWTIDGSGTEGHPITIQNATIDGQQARSTSLTTNSQNYLTLSNLTINDSNYKNLAITGSTNIIVDNYSSSGKGVALHTVSSSDITITNLTSTNNVSAYNGALSFNTPGTDLSISSSTITGSSVRAIYSTLTSNITLNDIQATNNGSAAGIEIKNMTSGNLNLTDLYIGTTRDGVSSSNIGYGLYINNDDGVLLNANGIYSKNNTSLGIYFTGSALTSGSLLENFDISHNTSSGIWVNTTPNLTIKSGVANYNSGNGVYINGPSTQNIINDVTMNNNEGDGFDAATGVSGLIVKYSTANYNGTAGSGTSGDGFSIHDTCSGHFYYNKAIGNLNTGMAHINTTTGTIYNNIIIDNGSPSDATMNRCGLYLTTTADPGFTVKNNILSGNYHCEIREEASSNNTFDYNLYNPLDNDKFHTTNTNISFTSWSDYSSNELHSLNVDPLFTDPDNLDFTLQSLSSAINAGIDVSLSSDYIDNSILGTPDMGIYEYQSLSFPYAISIEGYTRSDRPTLYFKKSLNNSSINSYQVNLDSGKNKSYSTSDIPTSGDGSSNYLWKDDNDVKIEFLYEEDSDSTNDKIGVYFKDLDLNKLTEGKHSWSVTARDSTTNTTNKSIDFYIDKTSLLISELAIANVASVLEGAVYNLDITNRTPSFSGLVSDLYQGSTVTNSNGIIDIFDKVSSGPKIITMAIQKLDDGQSSTSPNATYTDHLTHEYTVNNINDAAGDSKSARFYFTTPFPLVDGYYRIQLTATDNADNTFDKPYFYISINDSGRGGLLSNIFSDNLEMEITDQSTTAYEEKEEKLDGYLVKIKVLDKDGNSVEGVKVIIHSKVQETTTDKDGIAKFTSVEKGEHTVFIAYKDYKGEQKLNLTGDVKQFDFNIVIEPKDKLFSKLGVLIVTFMGIVIVSLGILITKNKKNGKK